MKKKLEKLQILMNILKKSGQVLAARRKMNLNWKKFLLKSMGRLYFLLSYC